MSNIQTLLRKRSITPMQTGKMILEDFLQTRKSFLQDPSVRGGNLDPVEKELLLARGRLSPNRKDMIIFLLLRDFMHEMAFRQMVAKQSFDLSYAKLSYMVELTTIAETANADRIGRKGKVSSSFFDEHRSENILNGRNAVESLKASLVRSVGFLKASNVALSCISRAVSMPSLEGEMVGLDGFMYDLGELQSAVDDLMGVIQRDGKEPAYTAFPGGIPVSVSDWAMCLELSQQGGRIEAETLKAELKEALKVNLDFDQTAIELYQKTFSLHRILKDGVADIEKLTNNLIKN